MKEKTKFNHGWSHAWTWMKPRVAADFCHRGTEALRKETEAFGGTPNAVTGTVALPFSIGDCKAIIVPF